MEINFNFVKNSPTFSKQDSAAEKIHKLYTIDDYRDVISNSRLLLETLTKKLFKLENLNAYYHVPDGEYRNLRNDTHYLRSELDYPLSIMDLFDEVRRMGNAAIHDSKIEPDKKQAWRCICDLHDILVFLINSYDGQDLYYIRPDIAMEAQTSKQFHSRMKNTKPHIKLKDHQTKKVGKNHSHTNLKKAKHFSSAKTADKPAEKHEHTQPTKQNWFTKLFHKRK
ncbi:hypothetical protein QFX17_09275 [Lactobacillus helveticus]|uniref:hypothetical protein n=1 Tax=Lactobacillus helveticus TaxID=1587 RepID=UPI001563844C|nr:hypothetical protein [Lactobacillus helveticus]MDN5583831.1 hypothetical protein [Lactobacillus sp.]MCO0808009.1 hypothetical protein [Lactobacillus helveticus]MCP9317951.1 hypothetical protein [Lactobacillus helveticus]MDH5818348.1 hypothetical protein [Lactobacillus helveticus]MDN6023137.1 hypothetical protein [Lactobacillus sp.]